MNYALFLQSWIFHDFKTQSINSSRFVTMAIILTSHARSLIFSLARVGQRIAPTIAADTFATKSTIVLLQKSKQSIQRIRTLKKSKSNDHIIIWRYRGHFAGVAPRRHAKSNRRASYVFWWVIHCLPLHTQQNDRLKCQKGQSNVPIESLHPHISFRNGFLCKIKSPRDFLFRSQGKI